MIKLILIVSVLGLAVLTFRNRSRTSIRAGIKLSLVLAFGAAIASIVDPGLTTWLARHLGVGQGVDLLLYLLVVAFGFTSISIYFRFQHVERRLAQVVRDQAIQAAVELDGAPGASRLGEPAGSSREHVGEPAGSSREQALAAGRPRKGGSFGPRAC